MKGLLPLKIPCLAASVAVLLLAGGSAHGQSLLRTIVPVPAFVPQGSSGMDILVSTAFEDSYPVALWNGQRRPLITSGSHNLVRLTAEDVAISGMYEIALADARTGNVIASGKLAVGLDVRPVDVI